MNTIRRGLKRKEPGQDPEAEEYQAGLNQFQVNFRLCCVKDLFITITLGCCPKERKYKAEVADDLCPRSHGERTKIEDRY